MEDAVFSYFRCPVRYIRIETAVPTSPTNGYFRIGPGATGYGRYGGDAPAPHPGSDMRDGKPREGEPRSYHSASPQDFERKSRASTLAPK
jgi:hypothetical protein